MAAYFNNTLYMTVDFREVGCEDVAILEGVCERDENENVRGSVKYWEILDQLKYCWVVKHGSVPWDQLLQRIINIKLRTLLAFAVSSSPFIKQMTACYHRSSALQASSRSINSFSHNSQRTLCMKENGNKTVFFPYNKTN
jgi:hypothetical protein